MRHYFRGLVILGFILLVSSPVFAGSAERRNVILPEKHEFRLAVGDMCYETLLWHDSLHKTYDGMVEGAVVHEDTHFRYSPHVSAGYFLNVFPWLGIGLTVDFQNTSWTRTGYDRTNLAVMESEECFYNLSVLPTLRFNYIRRTHWGLYSSLSFGMDVNGGTETDGFGRNVVMCKAFDVRLLGFTAGLKHFWCFAEFGSLAAMQNSNVMYMMGSELARAGISIKF